MTSGRIVWCDIRQADGPAAVRNGWARHKIDLSHWDAASAPEIGCASQAALNRELHRYMKVGIVDLRVSQALRFGGIVLVARLEQQDRTAEPLQLERYWNADCTCTDNAYV